MGLWKNEKSTQGDNRTVSSLPIKVVLPEINDLSEYKKEENSHFTQKYEWWWAYCVIQGFKAPGLWVVRLTDDRKMVAGCHGWLLTVVEKESDLTTGTAFLLERIPNYSGRLPGGKPKGKRERL